MIAEMTGRLRWCATCRSPFRSDFNRCPIDGAEIIDTADDLLIGQTLGAHYVIDSLIGEGAMSRVYRAHHANLLHKQFAVKVMIGDLTGTLEMRLRFAQEADAASQLEHPNVVSVVDFGKTDGGLMFLAMELVEGRSLGTLIAEEAPLPPVRALALARQIALGLGHAHDRGLIHRDLKPDNVIVSGDHARIVDFGLAIPLDEERAARLTHVGLMVGTPVYAAPEQTHNEAVDHRADLFALGVTLYEMLAGVTPYQGSLALLVRANASDVLIPIAARSGVQVPADVEELVRKLMRRDPAQRFQSAREVVDAIDELGKERAAVAVSVVALPVTRPSRRWIGFAAAGSLLVAAIAIFAAMRGHDTPAPVVASAPPIVEAPRPSVTPIPPPPVEPTPPPPVPQVTKPTVRTAPKPVVVKPKPVAPQVIEVAPTPIETPPPVVAPTPAPVVPIAPPPAPVAPKPVPVWTTATPSLAAIDVRGPLPPADVRRAIEKGLPAFQACYQRTARAAQRSPRTTVRLKLSFDDSRGATGVVANSGWVELATCVHTAAEGLRVAVAPDVGTADVVADILFTPVAP